MQKPILVLQMQRMGDLILSFPLLALLQKKYPQNPTWTVAEQAFFSEFYDLAPKTVFFPPSAAKDLQTQDFAMVINLSHRKDAIALAGQVRAEKRYGYYSEKNYTYIGGDWSLYKASIVQNNVFNLFHWSDLYLLEHLNGEKIPPWRSVNNVEQNDKIIGIFVGASEKEKRPTPQFSAKLAKALSRKGYRTFFLGGPEDIPIANEAVNLSGLKGSSLCGTFNLEQLVTILRKLTLFITPDTGPMHLAAWVHTPILNISLGPVNPWETGPRSVQYANLGKRNYIVQPDIDCSACWKACAGKQLCQEFLHPERIALLAHSLIQNNSGNDLLKRIELPKLSIYETANDALGRYNLIPINDTKSTARHDLGKFWQSWFWYRLHKSAVQKALPTQEFQLLCSNHTQTSELLHHGIRMFGNTFRKTLKQYFKFKKANFPRETWKYFPVPVQPFSGFVQLYLQNNEYSHAAWEQVLQDLDDLYTITTK